MQDIISCVLPRVPPSGGTLLVFICQRGQLWERRGHAFFFPRYGFAHGRAQEPTPGSAVKFRGKSVRKNRPLVPRSNIAGSWTRGRGGYPILEIFGGWPVVGQGGQGGGGYLRQRGAASGGMSKRGELEAGPFY